MTDAEISDDFRERVGDHIGEILKPWEEVSPSRTCTLEYRDGAMGGWYIAHHYPAGHTGGHRISDYEAACIILRQLGEWLDGRGIDVHQNGNQQFVVLQLSSAKYLRTSGYWTGNTEYIARYPDRPTAQLNAMSATLNTAA